MNTLLKPNANSQQQALSEAEVPTTNDKPMAKYYFAQKLQELREREASGQRILNLGVGSPDLPPPESAVKALIHAALEPDSHRYQSYRGQPALRQAFADWYLRTYGVCLDIEKEVLPLLGSKAGVVHVSRAFLKPGDEALVPNPGYPAYAGATKLANATAVPYELKPDNNWLPDLDALERLDLSKVKLMWINYPHMPTGASATKVVFKNILDFCAKHDIILVNDNPYSLILNKIPESLLGVSQSQSQCLELNSLSKSHNLSGMRVGVCVGNEMLVQQVLGVMSNVESGMYKGIQAAAIAALAEPGNWTESLNTQYLKRRTIADAILAALDCTIQESQAGLFRWARIPENEESAEVLSEKVLNATGVFITPGHIFGSQGARYLRISLCSTEAQLSEALTLIREQL